MTKVMPFSFWVNVLTGVEVLSMVTITKNMMVPAEGVLNLQDFHRWRVGLSYRNLPWEVVMTDASFVSAFESCTLPAEEWTHEAHIRLAWLKLDRLPYLAALDHIRRGIRCYNDAVLKKALAYHETITVAYTRLIADERSRLKSGHTFDDFKKANPLLLDRKLGALLRHYRNETLFSSVARAEFVLPDICPLPILKDTTGQEHQAQAACA